MAGAAMTAVLSLLAFHTDATRRGGNDRLARSQALAAFRAQLAEVAGQVRDVAALFESSRSVEAQEFADFTRPMLARSIANSLVFAQELTQGTRARFERQTGMPLLELNRAGGLAPAAARPRYAALRYGTYRPGAFSRQVIGLDLLASDERRGPLLRALRTGAVTATPPLRLASSQAPGFAIYAPVRGTVRGVVAGSFTLAGLQAQLARALGRDVDSGITTSGGRSIVRVGDASASGPAETLSFGGQRYEVRADAMRDGFVAIGPIAIVAGVLLTALVLLGDGVRRARRRLAVREARFRDAFAASPVGGALLRPDGRISRVNDTLCVLCGHPASELDLAPVASLVAPADRERASDLVERAAREQPGRSHSEQLRIRTAHGQTRWTELYVSRLPGEEPAEDLLLVQVIDDSERLGLESELRRQADHDALTELLNRSGLQRELERHLATVGRRGALMVVDLDHFKTINDMLGHTAGDAVLQAVGRTLRAEVRFGDVVARIGGDEFALLLGDVDRAEAAARAEGIVAQIGASPGPVAAVGGRRINASIGVAMLSEVTGGPVEALMAADVAMFDAKDAGGRRATFFAPSAGSATRARLERVDALRMALEEDRLLLVAQPIVDLALGRVVHHELLLRLRDRDGEIVAPGAFLPVAERFGLIEEIDRWVAAEAIRTLAAHRDRELVFEVNLSGGSLGSPQLLDVIRRELAAGEVDPGRLIFEITETEAVTNLATARAFTTALTSLGCRFALDDFGVGFGSFAYVKHLPFDFLKIDGEFVRHSTTAEVDRVILESLVDTAKRLGKRTIAEFVENESTVGLMRELGVDLVQGYHVGATTSLAEAIRAAPLSADRVA